MLPHGISERAKIWSAYIAKEVKCKEALNPNSIFLTGRTLLDNEAFNKLNPPDNDVVHGVQVFYGPFSSKEEARDFIADYPFEWPGENEWRWIHPGQPEIISSYYDPAHVDIVHNKSLDLQVQLGYQEMQRKIKEIEEVKKKIASREQEEILSLKPLSQSEKETHLSLQRQRIEETKKQLQQLEKHLKYIETLPSE